MTDIQIWRCRDDEWEQGPEDHKFRLKGYNEVFDPGFLVNARRNSNCETPGCQYFPGDFEFCPKCGLPLLGEIGCPEWYPPYGNKRGLKLLDQALVVTTAVGANHGRIEAEPAQVPGSGIFIFFAISFIGQQTGLFALERQGTLWFLNRELGKWRLIEPEIDLILPSNLPLHRWSAAFFKSASGGGLVFLPTDAGPQCIKIDTRLGTSSVNQGPGVCLGGGVEFGGFACFPVSTESGVSILLSRPIENESIQWTLVPVSGLPLGGLSKPPDFNAPIVLDTLRRILWIGTDGILQFQIPSGATSITEPAWIPWGQGWSALLEYGPPFEDNDGLWQLCFHEEQGYAYLKVGSKLITAKNCDGQRLTTGRSTFKLSGRTRMKPWESVRDDDPPLSFPLLESRQNSRVLYLDVDIDGFYDEFFETNKRLRVALRLDGHSDTLLEASIARPQHAQCFVYDKWVYIYHPDLASSLVRWRLADA